jgi:intracellular multiplication protein IcmK
VRLGLFVSAVCAVVAVSVAPFAQAQTVPGAGPPSGAPLAAGALAAGPLDADPQGSANENPPALDKAARDAIPLTPAMIEELAKRYNASRRAEEQSMIEPAAPINREVNVSFAPGAATSIVNTVKGYPTAVSFFDNTGQPWPIQWDTNSNPAAVAGGANCSAQGGHGGGPSVAAIGFYVCTPTKGSNVLEITPVSLSPRGGLVVSLEGAPKPVAFLLVAGGGRYDANLSIHVADRGPHAKVDIMTRPDAPDTGAPFLTGMLQGVPPADAVPLSVEGVSPDDLRAWRLGRNTYLRTPYTLISPAWTASEAEAGLTVYAVPNTPVVLLSVSGRTVSASLKD